MCVVISFSKFQNHESVSFYVGTISNHNQMCDKFDSIGICKFSSSTDPKGSKNQLGRCENVWYVRTTIRVLALALKKKKTAIWGPIVSSLNHYWQQILAKHGPSSFLKKIAVDHLCWKIPILFVFFAYTRIYKGKSVGMSVQEAWNLSASNVQITSLKVWPAVQTINFYFIPLNLTVVRT